MNRRGFTLMELLIALAISAVMLVVLASSMMMGYRSDEKAGERQEETQTLRVLSERLTHLIRGAYPFRKRTDDGMVTFFEGKEDSLAFVTSSTSDYSGSLPDRAGLKGVRIFLKGEKLMMKEYIFFSEDLLSGEDEEGVVLADGVEELKFTFLDPTEDNGGDWVEEWSPEEESLPAAVKAEIRLAVNGRKVYFPPLIIKIESRERTI